jgi:hypothetical protein
MVPGDRRFTPPRERESLSWLPFAMPRPDTPWQKVPFPSRGAQVGETACALPGLRARTRKPVPNPLDRPGLCPLAGPVSPFLTHFTTTPRVRLRGSSLFLNARITKNGVASVGDADNFC